jgi:hypothetical protein
VATNSGQINARRGPFVGRFITLAAQCRVAAAVSDYCREYDVAGLAQQPMRRAKSDYW